MKKEYPWTTFEVDDQNVFLNRIGKETLRCTKVTAGWRLQ